MKIYWSIELGDTIPRIFWLDYMGRKNIRMLESNDSAALEKAVQGLPGKPVRLAWPAWCRRAAQAARERELLIAWQGRYI